MEYTWYALRNYKHMHFCWRMQVWRAVQVWRAARNIESQQQTTHLITLLSNDNIICLNSLHFSAESQISHTYQRVNGFTLYGGELQKCGFRFRITQSPSILCSHDPFEVHLLCYHNYYCKLHKWYFSSSWKCNGTWHSVLVNTLIAVCRQ